MAVLKKEIDILHIFNKYGGKCAYCGSEITINQFHVDHIIPSQRGYNNDMRRQYLKDNPTIHKLENYNPSCISCNLSKNSFTIEKWRNELMQKQNRLIRDSSTFRLMLRFKMVELVLIEDFKFYFEKNG